MGCFTRKERVVLAEHKFTYINMDDFRSKSCLNYTAYIWIYLGTIISIACYAADLYTAVILLAYDRWTNDTLEKSSLINFSVARIIFSVCIFFSFILLVFDWYFAIRVIKGDGVADAYMNVIAVRYNCIRGGKGTGDSGWKRYLVFSRLTKSRGLVDYLALFTYFAFKGWVRIIFAEGPRVVINALTFISVTKADTIIKGGGGALGFFQKFGKNLEVLYSQNKFQVIILGTMAFTSLVWVIAILRLIISSLIYICYLFHAMKGGQSLSRYCRERIDSRMREIVQKKHDKALRRDKEKKPGALERQPTIPVLAGKKELSTSRGPQSRPDPYSSSAKLIDRSPSPQQSDTSDTPPPSYMTREPSLPKLPKVALTAPISSVAPSRAQSGRAPAQNMANDVRPLRTRTNRANNGPQQGQAPYENQGPPGQRQQLPHQQQYGDDGYGMGGQGNFAGQTTRRRPDLEQGQENYTGYEEDYQMQPLAPANSGRTEFVVDRVARNNSNGWANNQQQGPRGRFPIQPRSGPQDPWQRQGPVPRSNTAGPLTREVPYGPPPPRSQTAGPVEGAYGPPPRRKDDGFGPQPRRMDDGFAPPRRSNTDDGLSPPPRRRDDGSAPFPRRMDNEFAPAQRRRDDDFAPPRRNDGFLPRSHTAGPQMGGQPPRSRTAGPIGNGYGPPPRSRTAGPVGEEYGPLPPHSRTTGPMVNGYGPPPRPQRQQQNAPQDYIQEYEQYQPQPTIYGKPKCQLASREELFLPTQSSSFPEQPASAPLPEEMIPKSSEPLRTANGFDGEFGHGERGGGGDRGGKGM